VDHADLDRRLGAEVNVERRTRAASSATSGALPGLLRASSRRSGALPAGGDRARKGSPCVRPARRSACRASARRSA